MESAIKDTTLVTVTIAALLVSLRGVSCQSIPSEWHRLGDAVYLVDSATTVPFDQAQTLCQDYEANLARVDSDEIQAFLTTFITPPLSKRRCFWIGGDDRQVEGQFTWLDGTPVIYDGWAPNQPDDNGRAGQDCACLWSNPNPGNHGRWDDDGCNINRNLICQKGAYHFQLRIPRSNPGFAYISCAVDIKSTGETLSPDDVKLSIGQTLLSSRLIPYSSTSLDGGFRNNSFPLENVNEGDEIFCYVGELPDQARSFSLATLSPVFDFYDLPVLTSSPTVGEISSSSVTVYWSSWTPCLDSGDGPVISYLVYLRSMDEDWVAVGGIDSDVVGRGSQRIMEFVLTGLEPGTGYNISVSAVREGPGGEGPRSPHVTVITTRLDFAEDRPLPRETNPGWIFCGISLVANIILVFALVILCKKKQKKKEHLSSLRASPATTAGDLKTQGHYELPRPSLAINHAYQDLQGPGSSGNKEAVYADIDGPEKIDYVNISPEVLK